MLARAVSYGALAVPLALLGLPLYIFLPHFYHDNFAIPLSVIGGVLLGARLVDTVQDPFIGMVSDRWHLRVSRYKMIGYGAIPFFLCVAALFMPPSGLSQIGFVIWLSLFSILTYSVYSFMTINYYAIAVCSEVPQHDQTKLTTVREGLVLVGIVIAVAIGQLSSEDFSRNMVVAFAFLLLLGMVIFQYQPLAQKKHDTTASASLSLLFSKLKEHRDFRHLCTVFFCNMIAASLPATLVIFYVEETLAAPDKLGLFLLSYLVASLVFMPLWLVMSRRYGKSFIWNMAMIGTIIVFIGAFFLQAGDVIPFIVICVLSGAFLGADLALPPSILADILQDENDIGPLMGCWTLLTKLSLAIAGGGGLILVDVMLNTGLSKAAILPYLYALLPCVVKAIAVLIFRSRNYA